MPVRLLSGDAQRAIVFGAAFCHSLHPQDAERNWPVAAVGRILHGPSRAEPCLAAAPIGRPFRASRRMLNGALTKEHCRSAASHEEKRPIEFVAAKGNPDRGIFRERRVRAE
jgi:hypothetical protein